MTEIDDLHKRIKVFIQFINEKTGGLEHTTNLYLIAEKAYAKNNIRGMRTIDRDMNAWASSFSQEDVKELQARLESDISQSDQKIEEIPVGISMIVQRGKIANVEEYRIVRDTLSDYDLSTTIGDKLNDILTSYSGAMSEDL